MKENKRVIMRMDEQLEVQRTKLIQQREMEFQKNFVEQQRTISLEDSEQLIATHRKEMEDLNKSIQLEREHQRKVLCIP